MVVSKELSCGEAGDYGKLLSSSRLSLLRRVPAQFSLCDGCFWKEHWLLLEWKTCQIATVGVSLAHSGCATLRQISALLA